MAKKDEMPSHHGVKYESGGDFPNPTMQLLIERASCRSFSDKKITAETMQLLFEAATHAPTGGNLQPFSIIKIENEATKRELTRLCGDQEFISTAPVDLLFCIDWRRLGRWADLEMAPFTATSSFRHFWIAFQDTIIAAQNICTAADSVGLGSVYIGTVLECLRELQKMFELPDGVFPVVLLSLGYPKHRPMPRRKLAVETIVHNEKYRDIDDDSLVRAYNEKYPDLKIEITPERLKAIRQVCETVGSAEFADKCLAHIKDNGYISAAQRYFGLHYSADTMPEGNEEYVKITEDFGFSWFKPFEPEKTK